MCPRPEQAAADDGRSYADRVAASLPYIFHLCRKVPRFLVYRVDADDVAMEAVLELLRHERHYTERPGLRWESWVRLKTWNAAFRMRQTRGWGGYNCHPPYTASVVIPRAVEPEMLTRHPRADEPDDEPDGERRAADRRRVRRAMLRLPPAQRRAILEVYWRWRAPRDADRANGLRIGHTERRASEGRTRLRKLIST